MLVGRVPGLCRCPAKVWVEPLLPARGRGNGGLGVIAGPPSVSKGLQGLSGTGDGG